MAKHLQKKFTDEQVTSLLQEYRTHEIEKNIIEVLRIEKRLIEDKNMPMR